jgi:hypothetical protein
MPLTGVDGQVWLDTDGTLAGQDFVPLSGGTMTGNLNTPSINSGPIVGRNKIINGDFSIWQRGTTFTGTGYDQPVADRFFTTANGIGSLTTSRQSFAVGSAPTAGYESQFFLRYSLAQTGSGGISNQIFTKVEDARTFAGQTVTFSFWAKASFAHTGNAFIDRWYGSGGSAVDYNVIIGNSINISTTWQRFTVTGTIPSISGKTIGTGSFLRVGITSPAYTTVDLDTWGWQLEVGNQATPFHTATPNQQTELAACQRYYYRIAKSGGSAGVGQVFYNGNSNAGYGILNLPVTMRIPPSSVEFSNLTILQPGITTFGLSNVALANERTENVVTFGTTSSGGMANGNAYFLFVSSGGYFAVSAEL